MDDGAKNFVARVAKGGKITIPIAIRNLLEIKRGDTVEVTVKKAEKS